MTGNDRRIVGVVLAGGEGKRLRPITYYFQKCMIPVGNRQKPLLEYIVWLLKGHGIVDLKMLVGYKHEQIENFFGDGDRFGVRIDYVLDDPALGGSGGALLNAEREDAFEGVDALMVYYGDILSDIDLSEMLRRHFEAKAAVTLAVTRGFEVPVGVAEVEGTTVTGWVEKPKLDLFAGIGVVVLGSEALGALKEVAVGRDSVDIMGDLVPYLTKNGRRVEAYVTDAYWYDVGSTEKYENIDNGLIDKLFDFV